MKLKVINFNSKDVFGSIKQAVFTSALSYGRLYELLHKQIWRKAPYRITIATIPVIPTFNGRPVGFVRKWDIKSPSASPYSYDGGDYTFGLNQLFVGQDYRQWYNGNPKSGIYHDDCYITTKAIDSTGVQSAYRHVWCLSSYNDEGSLTRYNSYFRENLQGDILISSVVCESYMLNNISYAKLLITHGDGSVESLELGNDLGYVVSLETCDGESYVANQEYSMWNNIGSAFLEHGDIVQQYEYEPIWYYRAVAEYASRTTVSVFKDGTVIQFTPQHRIPTRDNYKTIEAKYSILPMIYLDTGDLAMDRVEFVDKWDDYFELIVHEDSEWWTGIIRPVLLIIAAIIIYCSWGALSALAKVVVAIGYAVYAAGVLTNNTNLMLIGGIMMAGVSIYTAVESAYTTTASTVQLSTVGTEQALAGTSFQSTFSGYASAAGMENLVVMPTVESYTSLTLEELATAPYAELGTQGGMTAADYLTTSSLNIDNLMTVGKDLYSAYSNTNQLLNGSSTTASTSATSDDKGIHITVKSSDDEDDVLEYIKKVIEI